MGINLSNLPNRIDKRFLSSALFGWLEKLIVDAICSLHLFSWHPQMSIILQSWTISQQCASARYGVGAREWEYFTGVPHRAPSSYIHTNTWAAACNWMNEGTTWSWSVTSESYHAAHTEMNNISILYSLLPETNNHSQMLAVILSTQPHMLGSAYAFRFGVHWLWHSHLEN